MVIWYLNGRKLSDLQFIWIFRTPSEYQASIQMVVWMPDFCVFWHANECLCMHLHGQKQWKTFVNHRKSTLSIMRTRGSCKAHEKKRRKKYVGQQLGVTPKSWLTFFFVFLQEPYMSLSYAWWKRYFLWFSNVFHHFRPCCACVRWSKYTTPDYQLNYGHLNSKLVKQISSHVPLFRSTL